jgi:hypothetical protein
VIVASSGGSPTQPNWYYNLKAHPKITVEVGVQTFTVLTDELADAARTELWPKLVAEYPTVGEHQAKTARQFPVFLMTRRTEPRQQPPASRRRGACISGSWQRQDEATAEAWRAEPRSKVTFDMQDVGRSVVKLTSTHDGFTPGSRVLQAISEGWPAVLSSLKTLLETGTPLPVT